MTNLRSPNPAALSSLVLLASFLIASCGSKPQQPGGGAPGGAMPVSVVKVQETDVPLTGQWVGTLDGFVNAQIQPQVNGNLIRQDYKEGSVVKQGQVLFEIDPRPFQAAVDQAQGQVEQAKAQVAQAQGQVGQSKAQLELAKINVNRDTPLARDRAIAQSQLDNEKQQLEQARAAVSTAEASVISAKASVVSAQAGLESAQLNLGFTRVRSLINGVAGQATTQVGNLVSPQSVLTSVSQLDPIKVYFSISDSEYLTLSASAKKKGGDLLHGPPVPLTLGLSDGKPYAHKGRIAFVDRQINQQTGAIRIAAVFPNPGNLLRPGQFGRVTADTDVRRNALLIPQLAVQELQGMQQVITVGDGNKAHVVNVTLGPQVGQNIVINSGLKPGATVITDNLQKLKEGVPVAPHPASEQPASQPAPQPAGN